LSGSRRINQALGLSPANIIDFPTGKAGEYDICLNGLQSKKAKWPNGWLAK